VILTPNVFIFAHIKTITGIKVPVIGTVKAYAILCPKQLGN